MRRGELNLQPTLDGPPLGLRPLAADDWGPLFAVASDPLIWALHPAHDRWREPVFRRFFEEGLGSGGSLVVIERANGTMVGHSRYQRGPDGLEIGWTFLGRAHWGGHANRELKRLMLAYALAVEPHATFRVGETNWRSRRAMEKIGGRLTDRTETRTMAGRRSPT